VASVSVADLRRAARLARDLRLTDWARLAEALSRDTGRPVTRRGLAEAVRMGQYPAARPARRRAALAVREMMDWAAEPSGPPPGLE